MRRPSRACVLALAAALAVPALPPLAGPAAAASAGGPHGVTAASAGRAAGEDGPWLVYGSGEPTANGSGGAYRYDTRLVPEGAAVSLVSMSVAGRTRTVLIVRGLVPHHTYGTHLHANACGPDPDAAGPHYQQRVGAPDDPDFADRRNEVWVDVRTNRHGAGVAVARNPWEYRAAPGAVVLHANATSTDPDTPGQAGPRVACVTLTSR